MKALAPPRLLAQLARQALLQLLDACGEPGVTGLGVREVGLEGCPAHGGSTGSRVLGAPGRIATSEAGQAGGLHGVRVLDLTPPPEGPPEQRTAPTGSRGPLVVGTWRRAHWKPGVRIGIRDSDGRLVGPVYKDGAVEGLTFTRERRFFPRARVRPDLPLAPTTPVYRIPNPGAATR